MNLSELHQLPPTLNARQVAEIFDKGVNEIYALAKAGDLPALRLGRSLRFPTARILDMLGVEQRGDPPWTREEAPGGSAPSTAVLHDDTPNDTPGGGA